MTNTLTVVTVRWQDGSITEKIEATKLVPVLHALHSDFWPEDFVIDKGLEKKGRLGVVKRVLADARTCEVLWLDDGNVHKQEEEIEGKREEGKDKTGEREEISMYQIESHPDFEYRMGCAVLRLNVSGDDVVNTEQVASIGNSRVGQITKIHDGKLTVQWADGTVSTVGPEEIFRVNEDEPVANHDKYLPSLAFPTLLLTVQIYDDEYYDDDEEDGDDEDEEHTLQRNEETEGEHRQQPPSFLEQTANLMGAVTRQRWWAEEINSDIYIT